MALLVWWIATKDGIVLMTLETVGSLWAFFLFEGWWVEFRVARKIKPLIPIDLREAIYGFGVVGTALAYLTGIIITLWVNPLPAMAVPPSKPLNPGSVNWQTPPLQELPPAFRAEVLALAEPVTQIAFEEGVPPEVPLVLWLKERGGHRINPQNGEGLCGFHNLVKSGEEYFRPGPISEGELLRQLRLCAREFKRRSSGISFETTDLNKLGPMYMRYNGNIDCHGQPFPSWKDHPYVMNGWDSSHQDMIARDGKGGCVALKIIGALPAHVRIGELLRGTASNP
jgi:hypothetical protein